MPDADGRFRGMTVPAAAWDRIFGEAGAVYPSLEDEAFTQLERINNHNAEVDTPAQEG